MSEQLPVVSIVGRPNVGKSSLFNRILRRRIAVVDDMAGVTRDRNYMKTDWNGMDFSIVDTGGMDPSTKEIIPKEINKQVDTALEESAAIIFMVESLTGPTDIDVLIAQKLRRNSKRVIVASNKSESKEAQVESAQHYALGLGDPIIISALHGRGVGDLLDEVVNVIKREGDKDRVKEIDADLSLSILGRPNAGKSSLVNRLLNDERMIVTNIPGTTRDAVDTFLTYKNQSIKLIDTAGLRKKSQVDDSVEYYANLRALGSVKRSEICLFVIDATYDIGEQDLKIIAQINKLKRGIVLVWNKWDIMEKDTKTFDKLVKETRKKFMELKFTPMISISALTGQRIGKILDVAFGVKERMVKRVQPAELREALFTWTKRNPHPFISSKQVRFLGIKQARFEHPHFTFYCSNQENVVPTYKRFLVNKFQEKFNFSGCPIAFDFKSAGTTKSENRTNSPRDIEVEGDY